MYLVWLTCILFFSLFSLDVLDVNFMEIFDTKYAINGREWFMLWFSFLTGTALSFAILEEISKKK